MWPCRNGPRSSAAAYLGVAYNPFNTMDDPSNEKFSVRNLQLPGGVSMEQLEHRMAMLRHFDTIRRDVDASGVLAGMDTFSQQAWDLVTSPKVQEAFDISKEDAALRDRYGRHKMGSKHAAGPAAGRSGRAVRHGRHGRLGHARQQLRDPEEPKACRSSTQLIRR